MKTVEDLGISPIPWYVLDDQKTVVCPIGDDISGEVAYCNGGDADISNARLIAAAPELYEALWMILQVKDSLDTMSVEAAIEHAENILAKAGGDTIEKDGSRD